MQKLNAANFEEKIPLSEIDDSIILTFIIV